MSNNKKYNEYEFTITRAQGLIGLRVKWEYSLTGGGLFVTSILEPCMISQLGYIEIGDEILLIDGKPVKNEADINLFTDKVDTDLVTIKIKRLARDPTYDDIIKKYGNRYLDQLEVIKSLKTTLRKDHIDIAEQTLKTGIIAIETGDFKTGQAYVEEALNNAFGTAAGINTIVASCYCTQAHIAYKLKKYTDARRHLWEAVELYKKLGESSHLDLFQTYQKLLAVADAQESMEDREFTKRKAEELQLIIMANQLNSTNIPELYKLGKILTDAGEIDDARDCFEKINRIIMTTLSTDKSQKLQYLESLISLIPIRLNMKKYDIAHHEGQSLAQLIDELYPDYTKDQTDLIDMNDTQKQSILSSNIQRSKNYGIVGMTLIWNDQCDYEKAKEYLLQSFHSHQSYYGRIHTSVGFICHLLAIVYRKLKQFHSALHYHHMAIRIYEILLGEKNLITISCIGELGITVQSRASYQMDVSEQIIDNMYIDMKRSNQNPYNSLQLYTCPLVRGLFYDHYNEVNRRSIAPVAASKTDIKSNNKQPSIVGEGEGPAAFLIDRGNILFNDECDYNSARVLFQQCYNYLCTAIGQTANLTLLTLYRLADSTRELGNYIEANSLYDQAVSQYLANAGDKVGLASAYYGWGESYLILGDTIRAKAQFTESLSILRNQIQLGVTGIDTYLPESGIIKVLIYECKWTESIRQLERLINKVKADLGPNNILLAHISILLAKSKRGKGLYSEIKPALDQAFVILRQLVSEDHLYFGFALHELGEYYSIIGDIKLAKEKYELALPIYETYYGLEHDMVYKIRTSISLFKFDLGYINYSLNEHSEILKGRERIFGANHPLVGESHLYIGDCLRILGHFESSSQHYEQAEIIIKKNLTQEHPLFATIRYSQAELARMSGKMEKSRMLHGEAMKIRREAYGKEHPDYVQSMQGKADLDSNCDSNMEEIVTLLKRILKLKKKFYGEDHTSIANTLNTYGLVLKQQNKYNEALEKFNEALKLRIDIGDPNHYTIGEIKNNIALVHASMVEGAGEENDENQEDEKINEIKYSSDGRQIYEPKPPIEHYEGVTDITPVFINTKYRKAIEDMNSAIEHILISFPGTPQYQHPLIANIKGNIGLIERLEDEGKRDFILRLTAKQRALFREAEEKRLTEEFANMSADFSDAAAGSLKLTEAIEYFQSRGYDSYHPWLRKFESLVSKNLTEIPSDAEPQNAQQLKANRKLLEARDRMKKRLYNEAKKYYEETLSRLPEAEGRPEDLLAYAMTGECLNGLADIARIHCKLSDAKDFYHRSLSILKKVNGNDTLQYAEALLGYSELLKLEGEYIQSNRNIDEVITIKKRLLGEKHESIVECLYKRCLIYLQTAKYIEGFQLCEYVLDARLKFPQTHEDFDLTIQIAETYNLLGEYFIIKGYYDKSEHCLQMTFKTCRNKVVIESIQDEDHMVLADSYHIKGMCRLKQNKFKDALRNFGHSLSMKMRLLYDLRKNKDIQLPEYDSQNKRAMDPMEYTHICIAISLYGQAEALRKDGNYQIAADLYLKATRMYGTIYQGQDNPAVANVMFGQAENYRLFGKFSNSEKIYQAVLSMRQRIYNNSSIIENETHPEIAESYIGLGFQRYDQCKFQDSLVYFEKALTIKKIAYKDFNIPPTLLSSTALLSSTLSIDNNNNSNNNTTTTTTNNNNNNNQYEHIEIGQLYLYIGMVHLEIGHYEIAEDYFNKSLWITRNYFPENHPVTCSILYQQARLYQIQQKYDEANVIFTLIISIISMAYGESHPEVGLYVIGQSNNYLLLGNYVEAKISAQRGLQIFNKVYGSDHPNTIRALLCIAKSLYQSGKYSKSLPYFQRALDFMLRTFPKEDGPHLLVSECYYELGQCLIALGKFNEAKENFILSLEMRRTILTNDHIDTLYAWSLCGETDKYLGNITEAEQIQKQILYLLPNILHIKLSLFQALVMCRLGNTIEKKGKFNQSKQFYDRSLYIRQKILGYEHPLIGETYLLLGRALIELGKYELSKGYYEKSLTLYRSIYRENHPITYYCIYGIAQCTRLMGYSGQAQSLYIKAITGLGKEIGIDHPDYYYMMTGFTENRREEGYIYLINTNNYIIPDLLNDQSLDTTTTTTTTDLTNLNLLIENGDILYAYPIIINVYHYFKNKYSITHYINLEIQTIISKILLCLGKFNDSHVIQKELLSLYKHHYNKEYRYLATTLYNLAEIERLLGKTSIKKKGYKSTNLKPDLSLEVLTGEKNRKEKANKLKQQKILLSSSQPVLPRIQSIAEKSKGIVKKKNLGFMGYQYPEIKTNDIDPTSPIDHIILNEIEVSLREKEMPGKTTNEYDPSNSMINEPKRLYDIALQLHIERYPEFNDHPFTGDIYFGKAELYRQRKDYDNAYIFYKKCYTNRLHTLRSGHPLIASVLFGLAENYRQSGNMKDAKIYYDQSLLMRIQNYESSISKSNKSNNNNNNNNLMLIEERYELFSSTINSHLSIAESQYGLSLWYYDKGLYKESIRLCKESLAIRQERLGMTHYLTLLNKELLAQLYSSTQLYIESNNLYTELLPVYKSIYPNNHFQYLNCLFQYASLLKLLKLYENSLKILNKLLKFYLGASSTSSSSSSSSTSSQPTQYILEITNIYINIGIIYFIYKKFDVSLNFLRKSFELNINYINKLNNKTNTSSLNNDFNYNKIILYNLFYLGNNYYYLENYSKAEENYKQIIDILERYTSLNNGHINNTIITTITSNTSNNNNTNNNSNTLTKINSHVMSDGNDVLLCNTYNNYGILLNKLEQYNESEIYLLKSLNYKKLIYGNEHILNSITLYNLGICYHKQNKLKYAKLCYQECYKIRKNYYNNNENKDNKDNNNNIGDNKNEEIKICEKNLKLIKLNEIIEIEKKYLIRK